MDKYDEKASAEHPEIARLRYERDAAIARIALLVEALEELHAVTMHPMCSDTPTGHIAHEAIQRARGKAFAALAKAKEGK